jgi:ABC-type transport system involved in multi-copper enzyme maturation permease subunit
LREVFRYELEHRLRSASTWIYAALLLVVGALMFLATADGPPGAYINSPQRIAEGATVVGIFGMFVSAGMFGDAAVRDLLARMDPLLYTTRLRKAEYLAGRWLATLVVNALLLLAILLGIVVTTPLASSFETVGPFRAGAFVQAYIFFLLPNLVLVSALLFAIATLARQVVPVYLVAIGLFIATVVLLNYPGLITSPWLAPLADPFGGATLDELTRYWTQAERNTRLIGLPPPLAWNRAFWLAVAAAILALLFRVFRFAHADGGGRRRSTRVVVAAPGEARSRAAAPIAVPRVAGRFGTRTTLRQTLAVARHTFCELAASRWFVVVLLACVALPLLWGWNVGGTVFDTPVWPVTMLVAQEVLSERFAPVIPLLIVLFAGELVWKEREKGAAQIADAAPLGEGQLLLGRFLALVAMIVTFQAMSLLGGLHIQALQGYHDYEPGLYVRILGGIGFTNYALLAALAMAIHVAVNQKYLGHVLALLAFLAFEILPRTGLVRHHLLLYASEPAWTYSDMNGFGPYAGPIAWFRLYWAGWALLCGVAAVLLSIRGPEEGLRRRLGRCRERFSGSTARIAAGAAMLIAGVGGFIFYNTNVLNDYRATIDPGARQAAYEQRYGGFEDKPQPTITAADLRIEIYPEEPAVHMRGTYRLANRTDAPIDTVHVTLNRNVETRSIALAGATVTIADDAAGYRIVALHRPLAPGDSAELAFDVAFRPRGFPNDGLQTSAVENGTYFDRSWLPYIGYQPMVELRNAKARERFGLPPQPLLPGFDDEKALRQPGLWRDGQDVQVNVVLGTAADQVAITPGELRRSWTENGRRYFHYASAEPGAFGMPVFSGRYALREVPWNGVDLRIYHHPTHTYVLDRMVRGMQAALGYFTEQFGPYPYDLLQIVEVPGYDTFGRAHAHTLAFTEDNLIVRVEDDGLDHAFFATAHEVAHQWWGGQVTGAPVVGAGFLAEGLANYSAMMVTEATYGLAAAREVYDFQMDRYLFRRGTEGRDVPLLEVTDQPWIFYGKGAVALYLLRDYIGAERVNAALRRYLERFVDSGPPYPTALDLYAELRTVTPESLHGLLTDLFETVTLWDVRTEQARVAPTGTGEYVVTLDVVARKVRADGTGNETEIPMDDLVEIGVFGPPAGDGAAREPLYLGKHRIRSGEQTVRVTVREEPARAGIDPWRKLIDRNRADNVVDVGAGGGSLPHRPARP